MNKSILGLEDWPRWAAEHGPRLRGVVVLQGPMGAGKTTLVSALGKVLGWQDTVQSPTFGLIHTYRDALGAPVYHLDLYRLRNEQEGWGLGLDELFDSGALCLVEWAEKIPTFLPENPMRILIDYHEDTQFRTVELIA